MLEGIVEYVFEGIREGLLKDAKNIVGKESWNICWRGMGKAHVML